MAAAGAAEEMALRAQRVAEDAAECARAARAAAAGARERLAALAGALDDALACSERAEEAARLATQAAAQAQAVAGGEGANGSSVVSLATAAGGMVSPPPGDARLPQQQQQHHREPQREARVQSRALAGARVEGAAEGAPADGGGGGGDGHQGTARSPRGQSRRALSFQPRSSVEVLSGDEGGLRGLRDVHMGLSVIAGAAGTDEDDDEGAGPPVTRPRLNTMHSHRFDLHRRSVSNIAQLIRTSSARGRVESGLGADAGEGASGEGEDMGEETGVGGRGGSGVPADADQRPESPGKSGAFLLSHAARPVGCGGLSTAQDGMHGVHVGQMGAISSFQESRGTYWLEWTVPPSACLVVAKLGSAAAESAALTMIRYLARDMGLSVYIEPSFEKQVRSRAISLRDSIESLSGTGSGSGSGNEADGATVGDQGRASDDDDDVDLPATAWKGAWTSEDGSDTNNLASIVDFAIPIGGDGTVLWTSSLFNGPCPPMLCFNMGTLGFMTPNAPPEHAEVRALGCARPCARRFVRRMHLTLPFRRAHSPTQLLHTLTSRAVQLNLRRRLACRVLRRVTDSRGHVTENVEAETATVLNEIVVDRGPSPYLTNVEVLCDGVFITHVQGDGLIIATPTGSTAYSLAAGGSMVHPQVPGVLLTPICPHSLSFRPLVFPDSVMLRVQVPAKAQNSAFVAFDGKGRQELHPGEAIEVCISRWALPEVCLDSPTNEWFNAITNGLHWNRAATRISTKRRYGGKGNGRPYAREKRPCDR